ncbi:MAG: type II toxin-antitoxin system Phd/YefM family antitoxin [bacterium]|nr:type II toxin-antitoxin system Phd/YefM family antitoxin [bacterium]
MIRIGITELSRQRSRIVHEVRDRGAEYMVTYRGEPVAVLRPYTAPDSFGKEPPEREGTLDAMKKAAREVARAWVSPQSAVELVAEQRR